MSQFAANIEALLPKSENLVRLDLFEGDNTVSASIENIEGSKASVAIYYQLAIDFGGIGPSAAEKGLELYAEYTEEAKANPGQHPNIDRFFDIIENQRYFAVRAVS